jgi:hypothetical protein
MDLDTQLEVIDGPFQELNKLICQDRFILEDRFENLEIDDEQENTSATSSRSNGNISAK